MTLAGLKAFDYEPRSEQEASYDNIFEAKKAAMIHDKLKVLFS